MGCCVHGLPPGGVRSLSLGGGLFPGCLCRVVVSPWPGVGLGAVVRFMVDC